MDDRALMLVLRLVHIVAGIFWVGGGVLVAWLLLPTQRSLGPEGGRFMRRLLSAGRLPLFLGGSMLLTVVSGFVLYGRFISFGGEAWARSRYGITLGIGASLALLAALIGFVNGITNARRFAALGQQIDEVSIPPEPALAAEMERLEARIFVGSQIIALLLIAAAAAMAMASYL